MALNPRLGEAFALSLRWSLTRADCGERLRPLLRELSMVTSVVMVD